MRPNMRKCQCHTFLWDGDQGQVAGRQITTSLFVLSIHLHSHMEVSNSSRHKILNLLVVSKYKRLNLHRPLKFIKGQIGIPKRMIFWKSSKRPLTPPLIFGRSCCGFVPKFMTEVPFIMAKICNMNFWNRNYPPSEFFQKFIRFGMGIH